MQKTSHKSTVLVLSDYDSRIKWGLSLSAFYAGACDITVYYKDVTEGVIQKYGSPDYHFVTYSDINDVINTDILARFDIVIIALGGFGVVTVISRIHDLFRIHAVRPVIITGFNGLTDPYNIHGLLCRYGSDIICVNSRIEYDAFRQALRHLHLDSDTVALSGYLRKYEKNVADRNGGTPIKNVLYVEQTHTPSQKKHIRYIIRKMIEYAEYHPGRTVTVKLRNDRLSGNLWHAYRENYPPNLIFSREEIETLLPDTDLCLSFTSTVIIEALYLGKKTVILSDVGICNGVDNYLFVGSGLLRTMDDVINDRIGDVNQEWAKDNAIISPDLVNNIISRSYDINNAHKEGIYKDITIYYNKEDFPFFYNTPKPLSGKKNIAGISTAKIWRFLKKRIFTGRGVRV